MGADVIGRRFGNYETVSLLGQGGMGAVYLAVHPDIGRKVAIKVLLGGSSQDSQVRGRFLNEARAANAIRHTNLIEVLDCGTASDGTPYLVMEYLEGESVASRLKRWGRLPLAQFFEFSQQIVSALGAVHQAGIVHRDLKPDNLFIVTNRDTGREFVKVLDFGIAKQQTPVLGNAVKTNSGMLLGTPIYMSPEQCRGTRALDARSDIYALGCVMHEMAVGAPPFRSEGFGELVLMHLNAAPPRLRSIDPQLPQALEALVLRCLAKLPEHRYTSMADVLVHLQDACGVAYVSLIGAPVGPLQLPEATLPFSPTLVSQQETETLPGSAETAPPVSPPSSVGQSPLKLRRRRWLGVAAALTSGTVGAGVAYRKGWVGSRRQMLRGIAVLPFENVGGVREDEFFADGIADDIIDRLSRLQGMRVISRTSTFQFKGKHTSPRDIGDALDVDALVEGSVQRMGSRLKINARLVNVDTGFALWSQNFARQSGDVFAIQSEIAAAVAHGVNVQITKREEKAINNASTSSIESYDEFLRGRSLLFRRTEADLIAAEAHFKMAIKLDRQFALAYCGLANTQALISYYSRVPPKDAAESALFSAQAALELDPELPEALVAMALPTFFYRWDFQRAEKLYSEGLAHNANYAQGHHWRCGNLMALRRPVEAMAAMQRSVRLDPLSAVFGADLAWFHLLQGRQREAEYAIEEVLRHDQTFSRSHHIRGEIWIGAGKPEKALESFKTAARLTGEKNPLYLALVGYVQGRLKRFDDANAYMRKLTEAGPAPAFDSALIHLGMGQLAEFFLLMNRAVDERSPYMPFWVRTSPLFASVRSDSRFRALLDRVQPI